MKQKILDFLNQKGGVGVSFAELRTIPGFSGGEHALMAGEYNIVLWDGMTKEAVDAMKELHHEGVIEAKPTNILTYVVDGVVLNCPVAKQARVYKEPHWLPATISLTSKRVGAAVPAG